MTEELEAFSGRLLPGERIAWSGRPATGLRFAPTDVFLVPFTVIWCGFAVFWTISAVRAGAGMIFILYGLMFVTFGLAIMVGRFFLDAWLRARTRYALTDRRVLINRSGPLKDFTAVSLDRLPDARLIEFKNNRGSIRFGHSAGVSSGRSFAAWVPALDPTPQFVAVPDARHVFDIVQRASRPLG